VTQQERWEENSGYSPSTLAAVISSLICAAEIARAHSSLDLACLLEEHADWIETHLEDWTVTNDGVLLPGVKRHYMRIRPPECGEPYAHEGRGDEIVRLKNQPPGARVEFEAREIIDAGFLELVRYGVRRADDPLIIDSLKVVDHVLKIDTPVGPCWRRYNHDGYGQRLDGGSFDGWGHGGAWPLLIGERAHYELAAGHDVKQYAAAMERFTSIGGMLPEQIWTEPDLPEAGLKLGGPSGSAMPLAWAHSEYTKLLQSITRGKVVDRIDAVEARYGQGKHKGTVEIFRLDRKIERMPSGKKLRIFIDEDFVLVWSDDAWKTVYSTESQKIERVGHIVDIATTPAQAGQTISFTFQWPSRGRWEGQNFDVELESAA